MTVQEIDKLMPEDTTSLTSIIMAMEMDKQYKIRVANCRPSLKKRREGGTTYIMLSHPRFVGYGLGSGEITEYYYDLRGYFCGGSETWKACITRERNGNGLPIMPLTLRREHFFPECYKESR